MHLQRSFRQAALAMAFLAGWTCSLALAGGIDDFVLSKAVPESAYMAVHARSHEGMAFLEKQEKRLWQAVENAHFERDLKKLFRTAAEEQGTDPNEFEKQWQQATDLAAGVNWSELAAREFCFAISLESGGKEGEVPMGQFAMLLRPPADQVEANFKGLSSIVETLAGLAGEMIKVEKQGEGESASYTLSPAAPDVPPGIGFHLARHKDVILLGFGSKFVDDTLKLLKDGSGEGSLAATPRFQQAFKGLAPGADSMFFMDMAKLMKQVRGMMGSVWTMARAEAGEGETSEVERAEKLVAKLIDWMDMWDYMASTASTKGMRTETHTVTVLRDDAKAKALFPVFYSNPPISDPLKYVPAEATSAWATSGVNLKSLYTTVMTTIKEDIPEAADGLAQFEAAQEEIGFNVEKDLLDWMQGGMIGFSIAGPSRYSGSEFVLLLKVSDEEKARATIDRLIEHANPMLEQQKGAIEPAALEGVEGFRTLKAPFLTALAMFGAPALKSPTFGVKDGWLMFGTSTEVLSKSLQTSAGKMDSFQKSERLRSEGIAPEGKVVSFTFSDDTRWAEEMASLTTMAPLMFANLDPEVAKQPPIAMLRSALPKLGAIIRTFDYMQSSCAVSTFDGKSVKTRAVQNYREPPTRKPTTQESGRTEPASGGKEPK